jgi:hypothetical protein
MNLEFSRRIFEQYVSLFTKIRPVRADWTDIAKLIDVCHNFANALKMNNKHANLLNQFWKGAHHIKLGVNLHLPYKGRLVYTL